MRPYPGRLGSNLLGLIIAGAVAAGAVARWRPFLVAVTGRSMEPELREGDWLVAVRPRGVRRGALVVAEHPRCPGFELVKRVVGVPGDRVGGRVLGPGELWVEGDRAEASTDSRSFGPLGWEAVRGVVALRYWPPGRAAILLRPGGAAGRGQGSRKAQGPGVLPASSPT
jgi:inner membrane protease subunit 1